MIGLARAIARAEIRRGTFALLVGAYALAGVLVAFSSLPSGSYPVLSGAVRDLVYLGPALMVASALLATRATELGVARELFLAGLAPRLRRRATAIVAVVAAGVTWLSASAVTAGFIAALLWAQGRSVGLVSQTGWGVLGWAAIGLASVGFLALIGSACGCLCRSRVSAIAAVALLTGVPLLATFFGEFPPALWLKALLPTGTLFSVFDAPDGVRGAALLRWGVPSAYLVAAVWVVALGRLPSDPGASAVRGNDGGAAVSADLDAGQAAPARAGRFAAAAPVVLLVATAALLGAVAPQRIGRAIPWWLQASWVDDVAHDRATAPLARAYLAAVASGDVQGERRRVAESRSEVLDPVLRLRIRKARRVTGVRYVYDEARPGTVMVTLKGRRRSADLTLCNVRTREGWRVSRVSSVGVC